jgi:endoglucanase
MTGERPALVLRRLMLRTARSPLKSLWRALYRAVARLVAVAVVPHRSGASVYLAGSLARGEPLYGVSDIDLVVVTANESESRRVRQRYEALCRALPPLRGLIPHFWTYDERGLASALAGSYLVNGLGDGRAVFLGADAPRDEMALLQRPGLYGPPEWVRLRGGSRLARPRRQENRLLASWLELQCRWRHAFRACTEESDVHGPWLSVGLVAEAARIWLWLVRGERHEGKAAPLERALNLIEGEREGLRRALDIHRRLHRSPAASVEEMLACFVGISSAIAEHVDAAAFGAGVAEVELLGELGDPAADGVPLLDWRAMALPARYSSVPEVPFLLEERLVPVEGDPADLATLMAAAARARPGRVPAMRHGALLVEPTFDFHEWGQLRLVQCAATDPVSTGLLDGRRRVAFPQVPGWSARDCARRAVAEHRAWLRSERDDTRHCAWWIGGRPRSIWSTPATLGLLFSAARAALFLESVEEGQPQLPLTFAAMVASLAARDPGVGADAAEAYALLERCQREGRAPSPKVVGHFRRQVESLPAYARGEARNGGGHRPAQGRIGIVRAPSDPEPRQPFRPRRGTNVSHWLSDTWGMTYGERMRSFTRDDALRIRELGLDHLRLPVEEHYLWHSDGRRDRDGFETVFTTIEWCRDAELGVILDLRRHKSHRYPHPKPTHAYLDGAAGLPDLWRDLSDALVGLPVDSVAYELLGEPRLPDDERWNRIAAECIAAIREREPDRTIVLGSNRMNSHAAFTSLSVPDDPHLILTFHYYEPMLLTHYRARWLAEHAAYEGPIRYPGVPIPAADLAGVEPSLREALERTNRHYDGAQIRNDLAVPVSVAERSGQPLYCGEFGVIRTVPDELRLRWYRDVIDALEEHGIAWSTWDLKGQFGLYNGDRPTIAHRAIAERRFADREPARS